MKVKFRKAVIRMTGRDVVKLARYMLKNKDCPKKPREIAKDLDLENTAISKAIFGLHKRHGFVFEISEKGHRLINIEKGMPNRRILKKQVKKPKKRRIDYFEPPKGESVTIEVMKASMSISILMLLYCDWGDLPPPTSNTL